jgi:hypothetical protein
VQKAKTVTQSYSRINKYQMVLDNRKHPIHCQRWRNGTFIARLTVEDETARSL